MRLSKPLQAVKYLLIVNIGVYLISVFIYDLLDLFALHFFQLKQFKFFQFFSYMFMHGSHAHIAFNMISLYSIGHLLERVWGSKRFLNFYLICGLGSGIFWTLIVFIKVLLLTKGFDFAFLQIKGASVVGASGAVFGIFTAVAMLFPNTEFYLMFIPVAIKAKHLLYFSVIVSVVFGFLNLPMDPIGHFGHLGGIITGYILVRYYQQDKTRFY